MEQENPKHPMVMESDSLQKMFPYRPDQGMDREKCPYPRDSRYFMKKIKD